MSVTQEAKQYQKVIEWSDEDQQFAGTCPGLFYGGCHGEDEREVFSQLCDLVEETLKLYKEDNKPLPPPSSGQYFKPVQSH
ncbi:MAG: hypothetical protein IEMM0008_1672 [bacterium]|nr:MAG: hypothetical protein IEMM0008_1672 [bacterium]